MGGHRSGLPLAIGVAVVAAGAATVVLRPRTGIVDPATVAAQAYFSAAELERATDFRAVQRILGIGGELVAGATLAWLALRPPSSIRRALERAAGRPWRGAVLAGAGISVALVVAGLPLAFWAHERAVDVGLSTQEAGAWFADAGKSAAIGAVLAGAGAVLLLALLRRFPRHWWAPASVAVVAVAAGYLALAPILIDPLFNKFDRLPDGPLRSQVVELADRAGVDVGEVYRVDASRRTTGANAYVGGLGHSKRVVLYDNLIDDFPRRETLSVVAHELGHVKHNDMPRGILWIAIVAPGAMFLVQRLAAAIQRRTGFGGQVPAGPAALPAVVLALGLVSFAATCAGNVLSRAVEARADGFALDLTRDPDAFIALDRRLALRNVSDPDPPKALHRLFGTHPTTLERIGAGVAYERRDRR
jgi:STE24 endopeptidase